MRTFTQTRSVQVVDINGKPTVISTFAGTGGSSLGYHWAGFKELLAIDFDDHAVQCFKLNFPDVPVWKRSVTEVTGKEILDFCNIKWGDLDVFDGSPPCQGFSTAGKRQVSDPRNNLFMHYCRLIHELGPKVFVMENVYGMAKGPMKGKFIEIMQTLKGLNYEVKCKKMNSMYYGVPQSRDRLIFIGVRKDLKKFPSFPIPSKKVVTSKQALEKIEDKGIVPDIFPIASNYIKKLKPGETMAKYHPKGHYFGTFRIDGNKPIRTILKQSGNQMYHFSENRCLGLNELKALCSFPVDWKLGNTYSSAVARLGNAVMPKFMQAIAETIKTEILNGKT